MINQVFNAMITVLMAKFMLNDVPHMLELFEYHPPALTTKLSKFYHATPWSVWENRVSKEGLVPQPLSVWIPGDSRSGIYLGATKESTLFFVEVNVYEAMGIAATDEEAEALLDAQEDYALLEVYVLRDLYLIPDEGYILTNGSYGAYISLRAIPRKNIQLVGRYSPSMERAKQYLAGQVKMP